MILKIAGTRSQLSGEILSADIGATKTNIAICQWTDGAFSIKKESSYKTKSLGNVGSLIEEFTRDEKLPAKISLAVAGPVENNKASLTNINWHIDAEQLQNKFGRRVFLINDLETAAWSLAILNEKDIHIVHKGEGLSKGNAVVIAPGTGLGEAGLCYDNGYYPFATEGGHASFAPQAEIDIELYRYLARKFEHVSWERVVSGPGICSIYDFLQQVKDREEPSWLKEKILLHDKATVISENATECAICREVMEMFIRYLAEECGNLVLKFKATGGIFIGGGIIPGLVPIIHEEYFLKQFSNFGRFRNFLQSVPVYIILNKKAPLLGAAYFGVHHQ